MQDQGHERGGVPGTGRVEGILVQLEPMGMPWPSATEKGNIYMALHVAAGRAHPVGAAFPRVQREHAGHEASDAFSQGGFRCSVQVRGARDSAGLHPVP